MLDVRDRHDDDEEEEGGGDDDEKEEEEDGRDDDEEDGDKDRMIDKWSFLFVSLSSFLHFLPSVALDSIVISSLGWDLLGTGTVCTGYRKECSVEVEVRFDRGGAGNVLPRTR